MNVDYLFKTGDPPKKLVAIVGAQILPSVTETLTPAADQYAVMLVSARSGERSLSVTIGGTTVANNVDAQTWNGVVYYGAPISGGSEGLTPFIGGKGEAVSVTFSNGSGSLQYLYMLLEDDI